MTRAKGEAWEMDTDGWKGDAMGSAASRGSQRA